jgi:hypothetical protein
MTINKAIALAGLVLALAILSPASALADAGGYRPLNGTGSSTITLDLQNGFITADGSGFSTHFAHYTVHFAGWARPSTVDPPLPPLRKLEAEGEMTLAAQNGDELYGDFHVWTGNFLLGAAHDDTMVVTITGGSGRFQGADGTLNADIQIGPGEFLFQEEEDRVPKWMVSRSQETITGQVAY